MTPDVAATATFYIAHFGFRALFEADWYVHLQSEHDAGVNLAVLDGQPPDRAGGRPRPGVGPDPEFRGRRPGRRIRSPPAEPACRSCSTLRDEDFGQRHFITADPNGVLIDIIKPIPPSADYAAQYVDGSAATQA